VAFAHGTHGVFIFFLIFLKHNKTCRNEVAFAHSTHGVFEKLENNVLEVRRNVAAGYIFVPLYIKRGGHADNEASGATRLITLITDTLGTH
jgi:hypothetical protein